MSKQFNASSSLEDLGKLAREAFETMPDRLRAHAGDVIIQVLEFSDDDTVHEIRLHNPFELSGSTVVSRLAEERVNDAERCGCNQTLLASGVG